MTPIASRKLLTIIGLVIMALATFAAAETPSNTIAVASISVAVFFGFWSSGTSWSLANACAPTNYAASLGAIMDFGGFIGGALAPMVTGFVVQATHSFVPALLVAGAIGLLSSLAYLILSKTRADTGRGADDDSRLTRPQGSRSRPGRTAAKWASQRTQSFTT
jgi:MFS family permease